MRRQHTKQQVNYTDTYILTEYTCIICVTFCPSLPVPFTHINLSFFFFSSCLFLVVFVFLSLLSLSFFFFCPFYSYSSLFLFLFLSLLHIFLSLFLVVFISIVFFCPFYWLSSSPFFLSSSFSLPVFFCSLWFLSFLSLSFFSSCPFNSHSSLFFLFLFLSFSELSQPISVSFWKQTHTKHSIKLLPSGEMYIYSSANVDIWGFSCNFNFVCSAVSQRQILHFLLHYCTLLVTYFKPLLPSENHVPSKWWFNANICDKLKESSFVGWLLKPKFFKKSSWASWKMHHDKAENRLHLTGETSDATNIMTIA